MEVEIVDVMQKPVLLLAGWLAGWLEQYISAKEITCASEMPTCCTIAGRASMHIMLYADYRAFR